MTDDPSQQARRGRGRPVGRERGETLPIRLSVAEKERIHAAAAAEGMTAAELVRTAVERYLDALGGKRGE